MKMRYFIFVYSLLVLNIYTAQAQQAVVQNTKLCLSSPYLAQKAYRLYASMDLLSMADSLYTQSICATDTNICLDMQISSITQMRMTVGRQSATWYAVPGKIYQWQLLNLYDGTQPPKPLQIRFLNTDIFNMAIEGFNYEYQHFLEHAFVDLVRYRDKSVYTAFEQKTLRKLAETPLKDSVEKDFFNAFVQYRLAKLRLTGRIDSKQTLIQELFVDKPILYNNPAYMELFKAVFTPNSMNGLQGERNQHIIDVLREEQGFAATYGFIAKQTGEQASSAFTDMVFLYSIKVLYTNKALRAVYLKQLLQEFIENSPNPNSRAIAQHLLHTLGKYQSGRIMPDWQTAWGVTSTPNKFNYILFYNPKYPKTNDLQVMDSLAQVAKNLRIISVYVDEWSVQNKMQSLKETYPHIEWLWFNNNYQLLNELGVKAMPTYYLIDHKNKLIRASAPRPQQSEDIKRLLQQHLKSY